MTKMAATTTAARARREAREARAGRQCVFGGVSLDRTTPLRRRLLEAFEVTYGTLRDRVRARLEAQREGWKPPEQRDLFAWAEEHARCAPTPAQTTLKLVTAPLRGGPNPDAPCVGCAMRARCKGPCDLLARLIPGEDTEDRNHVRSAVLSEPGRQDGGRDAQFLTLPKEWDDDRNNSYGRDVGPDVWPEVVKRYGGDRLMAAIMTPPILTAKQRSVMLQVMAGKNRTEVRVARSTSRQSVHKIWHAALRNLRRHFGDLPSGDELLDDAEHDADE